MKKSSKIPTKLACIHCDYTTSSTKDYNKHLSTRKHIYRTTLNNLEQENPNKSPITFKCECGKEYIARNSLWYHKQKCNFTPPVLENSVVEPNDILQDPPADGDTNKFANDMKELVMLLITSQVRTQESNARTQEGKILEPKKVKKNERS